RRRDRHCLPTRRSSDLARDKADEAGAAISDAWITSKVKSSFLFNSSLDGLDISVDTKGGQVTLGGRVDTQAEKDLATEIAENIRDRKSTRLNSSHVKIS